MSERRSKYHARRVTVDGIQFDSIAESKRYGELLILVRAGEIANLETHPRYTIWEGFDRCGKKQSITYIGDFRYWDIAHNCQVVEDVKSKPTITAVFRLKAKIFQCAYPEVDFRIVEN